MGEHRCQASRDSKGTLGVVIVAAGESRRMGGADKIFALLLGLPLIAHPVDRFEASPLVSEIVLVVAPDKVDMSRILAEERGWAKVRCVRAGGPRRQDSVRLGLEALSPCQWVAVHDGARPCLDTGLIERGVEAVGKTGAAVAAVPAKDTVKVVSRGGVVEATPPRETLWLVQTPQVFRYELLLDAHRASGATVTDDASMVEGLGHKVKVFMGSYTNLKVTTSEDLAVAELVLRGRPGPAVRSQSAPGHSSPAAGLGTGGD